MADKAVTIKGAAVHSQIDDFLRKPIAPAAKKPGGSMIKPFATQSARFPIVRFSHGICCHLETASSHGNSLYLNGTSEA
ncbi:MAG: hypothetical protein VXZ82_17440 [Planctomycetota bacterium]|nr:hypothetical protein [Planctomycetota bacterium]